MRLLIAAGGTAGQINPPLAIAGALRAADPAAEIHFAGRKEGMEYRLVTQAGYPFHHIEVTGFQRRPSLENLRRNAVTIWNLARSGPRCKAILNEDKPLLFHCSAGKDRTGCFTMVLLLLAGVSMDDINADYLASFAYLREQAHECKGKLPDVVITPNIDFIFEVVDRFNERYGDVNGYLEAIGLSDDEIAGLASILGKQEKSCGAVLFKDGKVLVEHMRLGHYSIPKGHVEKSDKDEFDTALREIREEVGLEAKIIPGFRQTIYYSPRDGVIKQVVFFAAEANEGDMRLQEEEVADAYWISPADAMRVLSHDSDRLVVRNAAYFQAGDSVKKVED